MVLAKLKTRSLLSRRRADCTKYSYDAAQNRSLMIDSNARTTYTCDVANQLNWLVDGTGRTTFSYDNNGNQEMQSTSSMTKTTLSWDNEGRLTQININGTSLTTYSYSSFGTRIQALQDAQRTSFTYDQSVILVERIDGSTDRLYTSDSSSPISFAAGAGSSFSQFDGIGCLRQSTVASAAIDSECIFSAFGTEVLNTGAVSKYRFNGKYFDVSDSAYLIFIPISVGYYQSGSAYYISANRQPLPGLGQVRFASVFKDENKKTIQDCNVEFAACMALGYQEAFHTFEVCMHKTKNVITCLIAADLVLIGKAIECKIELSHCLDKVAKQNQKGYKCILKDDEPGGLECEWYTKANNPIRLPPSVGNTPEQVVVPDGADKCKVCTIKRSCTYRCLTNGIFTENITKYSYDLLIWCYKRRLVARDTYCDDIIKGKHGIDMTFNEQYPCPPFLPRS